MRRDLSYLAAEVLYFQFLLGFKLKTPIDTSGNTQPELSIPSRIQVIKTLEKVFDDDDVFQFLLGFK